MSTIDLSKITLQQAKPWTPEEELAEAKAWGYDSVEAWEQDMHQAMCDADEMNNNLRQYGTIDKPAGAR